MEPGWIMDMYKIRAEYDIKVNGGKIQKRLTIKSQVPERRKSKKNFVTHRRF